MVFKSILLAITTLILSTSVNAAVVNTLNGVDYEWLELTATVGMSRAQVEAGIAAASPGDVLYGYEYASRALVEDLFYSYSTWDGLSGWHDSSEVINASVRYINDFGALETLTFSTFRVITVEFKSIPTNSMISNAALYGLTSECGLLSQTCGATMSYHSMNGVPVVAYQYANVGWDALSNPQLVSTEYASNQIGSHLVRLAPVPVPAAVWLFGSGLIGLIGLVRRKERI